MSIKAMADIAWERWKLRKVDAIYLRHVYSTPIRVPSPDDYIGPFASFDDAYRHRAEWGPLTATIVATIPKHVEPVPATDHIAHVKRRS